MTGSFWLNNCSIEKSILILGRKLPSIMVIVINNDKVTLG